MTKLHVIYVPGIGDDSRGLQSRIVKTWRWWGVDAELWSMDWADARPWRVKSKLLLDRIDSLSAEGRSIALVGASAGGSAVVNTFAARKQAVVGVVCIAGKINNADSIGPRYREKNRSFIESAEQAANSLLLLDDQDRARILSRYGLFDELVPKGDSRISGAHNHVVLSAGHGVTIALQLIFGAPSFLRFLKKQTDTL